MIFLAILLIAVAVVIALLMVFAGHPSDSVMMSLPGGFAWSPSPLVLYLLGAVTVLALWAGLSLLRSGTRRKMNKRREIKQLRKDAATSGTGVTSGVRGADARGTDVRGSDIRGTTDVRDASGVDSTLRDADRTRGSNY